MLLLIGTPLLVRVSEGEAREEEALDRRYVQYICEPRAERKRSDAGN